MYEYINLTSTQNRLLRSIGKGQSGKPSKRGTQVIRVLRFFMWTQAKIKRE